MWPLKKKFPPLESLSDEDEWSVGQLLSVTDTEHLNEQG